LLKNLLVGQALAVVPESLLSLLLRRQVALPLLVSSGCRTSEVPFRASLLAHGTKWCGKQPMGSGIGCWSLAG